MHDNYGRPIIKTAIITGAASGLGLFLAHHFAESYKQLVLIDLCITDEVKKQFETSGCKIHYIEADITDRAALSSQIAALGMTQIDLVINCAGILVSKAFDSIDEVSFSRCMSVNVNGSANIVAACLPFMSNNSRICLVASMAGMTGVFGYSAYSASKHAVIGLARALRLELKAKGIAISLICPPTIDTPMVQEEAISIHPATKALKDMAGTLSLMEAGNEIIKGIEKGRYLIIPGVRAKIVYYSGKLLPLWFNDLISDFLVKQANNR